MNQSDDNAVLRNFSALVDFSNLINSTLDLNFTLNNVLLTCFGKFHTTKGFIALFNDDDKLEIKVSKGVPDKVVESFPDLSLLNYDTSSAVGEFIQLNKFSLYQEIKSSEGVKGIIILGHRLTGKQYDEDDENFLKTILNVGSTAIENSIMVDRLKKVNRNLDAKVNQLSSLFDLSKEFSGILQVEMVSKMLVYSLIGQMLVSKYAVITYNGNLINILENRYDETQLRTILKDCEAKQFHAPLSHEQLSGAFKRFANIGADLVVPMQIKGETKGLIILGKRKNDLKFNRSDIEYVSSVGSLAIISIENARLFKETLEKQRLEKDLETARNIQTNLLPKSIPSYPSFDIAAYNKAARMVGGDYYDLVNLDENRVLFAIADVSGKGVPAALLMANIQAFLKTICKMNLPISDATNLLNDLVAENTIMGSFITFFWGILDNKKRELHYVNAGHNPPLHIRNGKISKLKKGGIILGVMPTMVPYSSEIVQLEPEDAIILFTDGITEAMNEKWEEYSDERLEMLVLEKYRETSHRILSEIKSSVEIFIHGAEQSDDITCLVIKVK
jgi:sigma-B regulation protein RsbU (phosphoserine phosphatase)